MYNLLNKKLLIYKIEKPQKHQKISKGLNQKPKNPFSANPDHRTSCMYNILMFILIYYIVYYIYIVYY